MRLQGKKRLDIISIGVLVSLGIIIPILTSYFLSEIANQPTANWAIIFISLALTSAALTYYPITTLARTDINPLWGLFGLVPTAGYLLFPFLADYLLPLQLPLVLNIVLFILLKDHRKDVMKSKVSASS